MKIDKETKITVHVPLKLVMRGGRKTIISPDVQQYITSQSRPDDVLVKALARAFRWRRMIEAGEHESITELAKVEKINQSYACRLLRLTLLAPELVEGVLDGRQNGSITLKRASKPFPLCWADQMTHFAD